MIWSKVEVIFLETDNFQLWISCDEHYELVLLRINVQNNWRELQLKNE